MTQYTSGIPKVRRHYLHAQLRKSNPTLSLKERNKIVNTVEIQSFLTWLGDNIDELCKTRIEEGVSHD